MTARIMIVEDEFLIRMTLSEALADEGFTVVEAASATEAMEMLQAGPGIDLLLTDIQLPGGDGRQVARQAREVNPNIPVVYMTGRPDGDDGSMVPGYDVFIAKPYLPSDVCAVVRRLTASGDAPPA